MAEVISIANQKGGVGKTTTAINLSAALAQLGQETLLIDLDPQGNATSGLGLDKKTYTPNIYHVLVELLPIEKTIKETGIPLHFISGSGNELIGAEVELTTALARDSRLRGALNGVRNRFKYILLDCPPSLGLLTINALNASDKVIIPIQGEYYAMEGLAQFMEAINKVKALLNSRLELEGGVLTMFDSRMTLSNQVKEEVSKFFGPNLFQTIIPRNVRMAEAPGFGQSIFQYDHRSKGAEAYLNLAREFLARRGTTFSSLATEEPKPENTSAETMENPV